MSSSIKTYSRQQNDVIRMEYQCKYVIRDYGNYRTISKVIWKDGGWDLTQKVDEYIIWRKNFAPI